MSIFSIVVVVWSQLCPTFCDSMYCSIALLTKHTAFMVQLSQARMTTGKVIALTRQNFVTKIMPLLFNMLSRLVIAFLPVNKRLLMSRLQSPSAVILEPKKIGLSLFFLFS